MIHIMKQKSLKADITTQNYSLNFKADAAILTSNIATLNTAIGPQAKILDVILHEDEKQIQHY